MTEQRDPPLASTTVLDRVRPTVVRRRVYEAAELRKESAAATVGPGLPEAEPAPSSSASVARTPRGAPPESAGTEPKRPRTLVVGRSIQVAELARRMSVALEELVEVLVKCGFFSTTAKTALRRESVRSVAEAFGWQIEGPPADVLLEHMSCPAV